MNICLLGCSFYSLSQRNRGALRLGITVGRKVKGIYIIQIMDDLMCLDFIVQMAAWRGVDNLYGWHYQGVISRIRDFRLDKIAFQGFNLLTELHCDELPLVVSILNPCHQSEGIMKQLLFVWLILKIHYHYHYHTTHNRSSGNPSQKYFCWPTCNLSGLVQMYRSVDSSNCQCLDTSRIILLRRPWSE